MVATPITKPSPYYAGGVKKTYWLDTLADANLVPTRAELDAGDDLSPAVETTSGFTESAAFSDVFVESSRRGTKVAGRVSIADSSITFVTDRTGAANVEDTLNWAIGTTGYIVMLDHGDVAATPCRVYKVEVGSISTDPNGEHVMTTVSFGIVNSAIGVTVPAAV